MPGFKTYENRTLLKSKFKKKKIEAEKRTLFEKWILLRWKSLRNFFIFSSLCHLWHCRVEKMKEIQRFLILYEKQILLISLFCRDFSIFIALIFKTSNLFESSFIDTINQKNKIIFFFHFFHIFPTKFKREN